MYMANPFIFFIQIFVLCSAFPPAATSLNNETDLLSLLAFKSVLEDPLGSLSSWNQTTHFCNWKGIGCGRRHPDRVVSIILMSQGLVGSLSPHLDLLRATNGFSQTSLVGYGKFGSVYKGILDDCHMEIAIKVLNLSVRGASRSFMAECSALRNARHRNLLKILSVCESIDFQGNDFKALVYEFKSNGSLEKWLHQGERNAERNNLNLMQRLSIAIDIAEGVEYLHSGGDTCIVHGDLKPNNILLDHDMTAYVGDFGLAKFVSDIIPSHESNSSIGIRGTVGYIPPEYGVSCPVSMQGDVYSYGIVLLEMFTNKRPTDDLLEDHVNLHCFVNASLPDQVMEVVAPLFQTHKNNDTIKDCLTSILSIGVSCSKEMPKDRMVMSNVVFELHKIQKLLYS